MMACFIWDHDCDLQFLNCNSRLVLFLFGHAGLVDDASFIIIIYTTKREGEVEGRIEPSNLRFIRCSLQLIELIHWDHMMLHLDMNNYAIAVGLNIFLFEH